MHRRHLLPVFALLAVASPVFADPPELASWLRNTDGHTGFGGLPADVQQVAYSDSNVYVSCSGIPGYTIGPWPGNPNTALNQNFVFRIPRSPQVTTGTKTSTPLGQIAVWTNGVCAYNPLDAHSYNNQNVWHQNAVVVEAPSFDACLGHPDPASIYHHHQDPRCLWTSTDSLTHAPILGYSFDGYPIYGSYGYANADGSGGIRRILSSYRLRNITTRTTLPDGTVLPPSQYGPAVSSSYPLGYYVEDFEYVDALGDLDRYNGRFAVTPEYPSGTYAYYVTIDGTGASAYPRVIGPQYYGALAAGDTGPGGGHVTITEQVTIYNGQTAVEPPPPSTGDERLTVRAPALPLSAAATLSYTLGRASHVVVRVFDMAGRLRASLVDADRAAGAYTVPIPSGTWPSGLYLCQIDAQGETRLLRLALLR